MGIGTERKSSALITESRPWYGVVCFLFKSLLELQPLTLRQPGGHPEVGLGREKQKKKKKKKILSLSLLSPSAARAWERMTERGRVWLQADASWACKSNSPSSRRWRLALGTGRGPHDRRGSKADQNRRNRTFFLRPLEPLPKGIRGKGWRRRKPPRRRSSSHTHNGTAVDDLRILASLLGHKISHAYADRASELRILHSIARAPFSVLISRFPSRISRLIANSKKLEHAKLVGLLGKGKKKGIDISRGTLN
ncbi:hypothetical protein V8C42DRAFT_161738 [Trichoderma barbatum]